jgi:hypothetical protein
LCAHFVSPHILLFGRFGPERDKARLKSQIVMMQMQKNQNVRISLRFCVRARVAEELSPQRTNRLILRSFCA